MAWGHFGIDDFLAQVNAHADQWAQANPKGLKPDGAGGFTNQTTGERYPAGSFTGDLASVDGKEVPVLHLNGSPYAVGMESGTKVDTSTPTWKKILLGGTLAAVGGLALAGAGGASGTAGATAGTAGSSTGATIGATGAAAGTGDWLSKLKTLVGIGQGIGSAVGTYQAGANQDKLIQLQQDQFNLTKQQNDQLQARKAALVSREQPFVDLGNQSRQTLGDLMGYGRPSTSATSMPTPPPPTQSAPGPTLGQLGQGAASPAATPKPPSTTQQPGFVPMTDDSGQVRYVAPEDVNYWTAKGSRRAT